MSNKDDWKTALYLLAFTSANSPCISEIAYNFVRDYKNDDALWIGVSQWG